MMSLFILSGCMGNGNPSDESMSEKSRVSQFSDTLYSEKAVLSIYGTQPARALQMIDTAELLGNLTETRADFLRAVAQFDSARFQAQEQQREIERQREAAHYAEASRTVIGFIGLFIFLIAIVSILQLRSVKQRNRILAQQITEAVNYKEKYDKLKRSVEANGLDLKSPNRDNQLANPTEPKEKEPVLTLDIQHLSTLSDAELFDYLRDLIEREQLFLNPNFERQTLISRTGLSKERIGAAFAQASDYERLTTLVRELRLNYAVRLLNEQPELSIEQVCMASGFANTVSFNRSFKAKYGMTPSKFRETKA